MKDDGGIFEIKTGHVEPLDDNDKIRAQCLPSNEPEG